MNVQNQNFQTYKYQRFLWNFLAVVLICKNGFKYIKICKKINGNYKNMITMLYKSSDNQIIRLEW